MKRISLNKVMAKLAEEQTPEMIELASLDSQMKGDSRMDKGYNFLEQAMSIIIKAQGAFSNDFKAFKENIQTIEDYISKAKEIGADDYVKDLEVKIKGQRHAMGTAEMEIDNLEKAYKALR